MSTFADPVRHSLSNGQRRGLSEHAAADRLTSAIGKLGDACLVAAVFVVPMMSAGMQDVGNAVFVTCSLLMGLSWAVPQILAPATGSRFCGAEIIVAAAVALVTFQLMELPPSVIRNLAPFADQYLTLWGTADGKIIGSGPWSTVSLTPSLTRSGQVLLIAYGIFFLTLIQKLKSTKELDAVIRMIAIASSLMAVIGLLQLATRSELFLWMFEHPFRSAAWPAKAAFSNPNHFAHFLALGIGPLIWWWNDSTEDHGRVIKGSVKATGFGLQRSTEAQKRLIGSAIAVVLLGGLLSCSRAGIVALVVACGIALRIVSGQWKYLLRFTIPIVAFVVISALFFGTEQLERKWNSIQQADSMKGLLAGRFVLWETILEAMPVFWKAGSGLGSHAEIYPTWMEEDFGVRFSHAESGYLQVLLELGLPGMLLLLSGIGLAAFWSWKCLRTTAVRQRNRALALSASLVVSVLHSLVDFVWYIPGCMIVTLMILACLCRCWQLGKGESEQNRPQRWPAVLAWTLVILTLPLGKLSAAVLIRDASSEYDWNQYRKHSINANNASSYESLDSLDDRLDAIILHLENCITKDPSDFRAASDLCAMYLRRFEREQLHAENQMNVREIKGTVQNAEFESPREIAEWLNRAFGHSASDLYRALRVAKMAVRGQPVRGETYLILAQVGFLVGMTESEEQSLIDQAIRLRPHKASVLFLAGLSRVEKGELADASRKWQRAFQLDPAIRPMIVKGLAPFVSAADLIEQLEPGPDGIWLMFTEYRRRNQSSDVDVIIAYFQSRFSEFVGDAAVTSQSYFWERSHDMLLEAGRDKESVACLLRAVEQNSADFKLRKKLALRLVAIGAKDKARQQLEWCQLRNTDDREITEALEAIHSVSEHGRIP